MQKTGTSHGWSASAWNLANPMRAAAGARSPLRILNFLYPSDSVITALGQATQTSFVEGIGVSLAKNGTIEVDPATGVTNIEGVFAGGDVSTGPAYVVDAIAAGQKAAKSISRYLKGEPVIAANEAKKPERLTEAEVADLTARIPRTERIHMPEVNVEERVTNFEEVAIGYSPEEASAEASRCLAGQIEGCIQCGECERLCEVKAIDYTMQDEIVEIEYDSIVLAPGFDLYDPTEKREYGYGTLEGVMTGIEFETDLFGYRPDRW